MNAFSLTPEQIHAFHRDGLVRVPQVFSQGEIERLRAAAARAFVRAQARQLTLKPAKQEVTPLGDLLSHEGLDYIIFDDRVLSVAEQLVGKGLIYFGDSSVQGGYGPRGMHKDNAERSDPTHTDWTSPHTMIRLGVYLQDHDRWSGGLKVRLGSHNTPRLDVGELVDVPSRAGDLLAWSLRISHSGNCVKLRGLPGLSLSEENEARLERLPSFMSQPRARERIALFLTYGKDDVHLKSYIDKYTGPSATPDNYMLQMWRHSVFNSNLEALARAKGCEFRRFWPGHGSQAEAAA